MKRRLVQITAGCAPGDAITNEIRLIHEFSDREIKYFSDSVVYADHIASDVDIKVKPLRRYVYQKKDVILYHYSISTSGHVEYFRGKDIFLVYHNITPSEYFIPYNPVIAGQLIRAREELPLFSNISKITFAHSKFNADELREYGFNRLKILPVLFKPLDLTDKKKFTISQKKINILFVGRIVPNKNHCALIKILYFVKKIIPSVQLILAGGTVPGMESYSDELKKLIAYLDLVEDVEITGFLSNEELQKIYMQADIFLCTSLHEGFCVPLLEAMQYNIPVVAYTGGNSAVKETLAGSGVELTKMCYEGAAEVIAEVINNKMLRERIIANQNERIQHYNSRELLSELFNHLCQCK